MWVLKLENFLPMWHHGILYMDIGNKYGETHQMHLTQRMDSNTMHCTNWQSKLVSNSPDTCGDWDLHCQKEQQKWDTELLTCLRALPGAVKHVYCGGESTIMIWMEPVVFVHKLWVVVFGRVFSLIYLYDYNQVISYTQASSSYHATCTQLWIICVFITKT